MDPKGLLQDQLLHMLSSFNGQCFNDWINHKVHSDLMCKYIHMLLCVWLASSSFLPHNIYFFDILFQFSFKYNQLCGVVTRDNLSCPLCPWAVIIIEQLIQWRVIRLCDLRTLIGETLSRPSWMHYPHLHRLSYSHAFLYLCYWRFAVSKLYIPCLGYRCAFHPASICDSLAALFPK